MAPILLEDTHSVTHPARSDVPIAQRVDRDAYALDLRQFIAWCDEHRVRLFAARRADIECFARDLEARGRARATVARRLCTVAGFYRYAEQEGLLERSPAAHVAGLASTTSPTPPAWTATRWERSSSLPGWPRPASTRWFHSSPSTACACRRLSAPTSRRSPSNAHGAAQGRQGRYHPARPAHGSSDRPDHRRTGRRADLLGRNGEPLDRHAAWRIVRRLARKAGINKPVGPHTLRHAFITAALDAGVPLRDVQEAASHADPRTTMRYDRARVSLDRHSTYVVAAFLAGAAR